MNTPSILKMMAVHSFKITENSNHDTEGKNPEYLN